MVAVISTSTSISNALNYNEQKVTQQVAVCIDAVNYPKDAEDLNFEQECLVIPKTLFIRYKDLFEQGEELALQEMSGVNLTGRTEIEGEKDKKMISNFTI